MTNSDSIVIEIDSDVEEISLACVAANALCAYFSVPRMVCFEMVLCIDEILNNIIEHDLGFTSGTRIRIQVGMLAREVEIQIDYPSCLDLGPWLISRVPPDPQLLPERGFGCFLVSKIMDEVSYLHSQQRNHFFMRKTLAKPTRRKDKPRMKVK